MIKINLRKSIFSISIIISLVLLTLIGFGLRQKQLHQHYESVVEQSEKILMHFTVVREHITQALLGNDFSRLAGAAEKISELNGLFSQILDNQHIAQESKLIFINQMDLTGIIALLENAASSSLKPQEQAELAGRIRELGDRLMLFNRVMAIQTKTKLVNFQTLVIGSLAFVLFILINILVLWYRQIGIPLLNLMDQAKLAAAGHTTKTCKPGRSVEINEICRSLQTIVKEKDDFSKQLMQEAHFTSFLRQSLQPLSGVIRRDGTILSLNSEAQRFCGKEIRKNLGCNFKDVFLSPHEHEPWDNMLREFHWGGGDEKTFSLTVWDKTKEKHKVISNIQKINSSENTFLWTGLSIDDQTADLSPVEVWEHEQKSLMDMSKALVMVLSQDDHILSANSTLFSTLDLIEENIIGRYAGNLFFNNTKTDAATTFRSLMQEEYPTIFKSHLDCVEGEHYMIMIPFFDHGSKKASRKLLIISSVEKLNKDLPGNIQEAHLHQMTCHAGQVMDNIKGLTEDVENYANALAGTIKNNNHNPGEEDLSEKIAKEGKRVSGIIHEQGALISEIVEKLTNLHGG